MTDDDWLNGASVPLLKKTIRQQDDTIDALTKRVIELQNLLEQTEDQLTAALWEK